MRRRRRKISSGSPNVSASPSSPAPTYSSTPSHTPTTTIDNNNDDKSVDYNKINNNNNYKEDILSLEEYQRRQKIRRNYEILMKLKIIKKIAHQRAE